MLLLVGAAVFYLRHPVWFFQRQQIKIGEKIISQVEASRKNHGRLPADLKEVGIDDSDDFRVFYEKMNENDYCVWFGTTLGESESYTSRTRKWDDLNCAD